MTERKPFAIRFPVELHAELKTHAFLTGESMAATINRLVADYLAGEGKRHMDRARRARNDWSI
jgi:hypothetical protein